MTIDLTRFYTRKYILFNKIMKPKRAFCYEDKQDFRCVIMMYGKRSRYYL